jgi:hypothetical protein
MRNGVRLVGAALLLACGAGCGGGNDAICQDYLDDLATLVAAWKQAQHLEGNKVAMRRYVSQEQMESHFSASVAAVKALGERISDEEKLRLQLKYGPPAETLAFQLDKEIMRLLNGQDAKNAPAEAKDALSQKSKAALSVFLVEGYGAMEKATIKDVNELTNAVKALQNADQAKNAIPKLRKLRYHLTLDGARLQHWKVAREKAAHSVGLPDLPGPVAALKAEVSRLRAMQGGGAEAADVIEPLPPEFP